MATSYDYTGGYGLDYDDIFSQAGNASLYEYMINTAQREKIRKDRDEDEYERKQYENMAINQIPGIISKSLSGRDIRAGQKLQAWQNRAARPELSDEIIEKYGEDFKRVGGSGPHISDVTANPGYSGQTTVERTLQPWNREQPFTPSEPGVFNKAGEQIATSEVGYGHQWGAGPGKLSRLKLNPETGLYEKKIAPLKYAQMGASLYDAYQAGDIGTDDHIFKKGGKQHTLGDWGRFLAPALAATPYGWGGAAAVQGGINAWEKWGKGTKLDKNLRKISWKNIFKK